MAAVAELDATLRELAELQLALLEHPIDFPEASWDRYRHTRRPLAVVRDHGLESLAIGSSRIVFPIDEGLIAKVAWHHLGLACNLQEAAATLAGAQHVAPCRSISRQLVALYDRCKPLQAPRQGIARYEAEGAVSRETLDEVNRIRNEVRTALGRPRSNDARGELRNYGRRCNDEIVSLDYTGRQPPEKYLLWLWSQLVKGDVAINGRSRREAARFTRAVREGPTLADLGEQAGWPRPPCSSWIERQRERAHAELGITDDGDSTGSGCMSGIATFEEWRDLLGQDGA